MNKKYIKKYIKYYVLCVIIGLLIGNVIGLRIKINKINNQIKQIHYEKVELKKCPLCNGDAVLKLENYNFYIECDNCKLHTNYFDSKEELIDYWNCFKNPEIKIA